MSMTARIMPRRLAEARIRRNRLCAAPAGICCAAQAGAAEKPPYEIE
ncbi:MAG: hypothetical protein OYG32_13330 [Rhodospirillaceae bacterium]|nr:hypothetical protein [Rhodospirillaceae bacterium]MDE0619240.1 hypothetical protein [Rhodospirillaceae bacterium]